MFHFLCLRGIQPLVLSCQMFFSSIGKAESACGLSFTDFFKLEIPAGQGGNVPPETFFTSKSLPRLNRVTAPLINGPLLEKEIKIRMQSHAGVNASLTVTLRNLSAEGKVQAEELLLEHPLTPNISASDAAIFIFMQQERFISDSKGSWVKLTFCQCVCSHAPLTFTEMPLNELNVG